MLQHEGIERLLAKWDEARQQGPAVPVEELCADSPELLPILKDQIDQLKAMDWLDSSMDELDRPPGSWNTATPLEPPSGPSRVPATLGGRYVLQSLIAEGGFAQVWRAVDTSLQRPVAVKVTTVNCYSEARRVAQLKHHGIIAVHDVGSEDGLCYIVFDLVEGRTLAEKIAQGTMTWQSSARVVAEVAGHLQFRFWLTSELPSPNANCGTRR